MNKDKYTALNAAFGQRFTSKYKGSASGDLPPKAQASNSLHRKYILQDNTLSSKTSENYDCKYNSAQHNGAVRKERVTPMSLYSLQNLIKKSADEILCAILDKESGFILALGESFNQDYVAYILIALGKAIRSKSNKNTTIMFNIVSNKFLISVQKYLTSFQAHKPNGLHVKAVVYLIRFLLNIQNCQSFSARDILVMLLPLLEDTCKRHLSQNEKAYSESSKMLKELNSSLRNKFTLNQIKEKSHNENHRLWNPPEDYRSIPVLPNKIDIRQPSAYLCPNIIKGKYQHTEHYLDVQFRLLREDYVRPLREGITEYLTLKDRKNSLKRVKDINVYPEVQIIKQEFVNNELLHLAYIKDKEFAKIKWEFSKRLLSKSLLCLSSDNFKTMLFATVEKRDPEELAEGLLFLRFEELTDEVLNLDPSLNFVVIENSAYFEAYRYNLEALQKIKDGTLPMKRYIVETQKNVLKPQYLSDTVTYDLSPVHLPLNEASKNRDVFGDTEFCSDYIYSRNVPENLKNVAILNNSSWPTFSDLNLDSSQCAAIKAAITKEFVIIQGPPGTGKTYVGRRIIQLLLHNVDKWQSKFNSSPILVVCNTNHALDQFLEGILTFTKKIVRIGGGGSNETISNFRINNLKRNTNFNKEFLYSIKAKREQLRTLINSLEESNQSIEKSYASHQFYNRKTKDTVRELHQRVRQKYNELQEMRTQEDIYVCKQSLVIGMTTTGAAKYRHLVQNLNPGIVIVEEAAEVLESHIVTSLARGTQHLILIGDHQQLRPSPTVHLLATKYGMDVSLFERMVENGLDYHQLEIQHRMRPEIASLLVPHIYTKLHNDQSVKKFENIKGMAKNVFFVDHTYHELPEKDSTSKINVHEANFMLKLCKYLINQGYKSSQITVLTTYSGQLSEFKRSPLISELPGVRFTVVDNFQGEQSDIILISFVRSNAEGQIGFLKISNRVCVALSRARKGLYCIGNFSLFAEKSHLWKNITKTLEDNRAIGPSLFLVCQNHPDTSTAVTNKRDFNLVSEGGCTRQCEFRLQCGHQCSLKCHPYDPKHKKIHCTITYCAKQLREKNLCNMKLYEESPPFVYPVPKTTESPRIYHLSKTIESPYTVGCRSPALQIPSLRSICSIL